LYHPEALCGAVLQVTVPVQVKNYKTAGRIKCRNSKITHLKNLKKM